MRSVLREYRLLCLNLLQMGKIGQHLYRFQLLGICIHSRVKFKGNEMLQCYLIKCSCG